VNPLDVFSLRLCSEAFYAENEVPQPQRFCALVYIQRQNDPIAGG